METLLVRDWMTPNPIVVTTDTTLPDAHKLMRTSSIRRLPVIHHGKLVGIVTLGDIREARPSNASSLSIYEMNYLLSQLTIGHIMTKQPITITPDTTVANAAQIMLEQKIGGIPVIDNDQLVGIITESDIFRVIMEESECSPKKKKAAKGVR